MLITRIVHIGQVGPLDECIVKLTTAYLVTVRSRVASPWALNNLERWYKANNLLIKNSLCGRTRRECWRVYSARWHIELISKSILQKRHCWRILIITHVSASVVKWSVIFHVGAGKKRAGQGVGLSASIQDTHYLSKVMVMFENDWIFYASLPHSGWKDWHIGNRSQSNLLPLEMFVTVTLLLSLSSVVPPPLPFPPSSS